jgi:hypothetical protein
MKNHSKSKLKEGEVFRQFDVSPLQDAGGLDSRVVLAERKREQN